jgi:hypothetical protein
MEQDAKGTVDRRSFLKRFAMGAAVVPLASAAGCFCGPIGFPGGGGGGGGS